MNKKRIFLSLIILLIILVSIDLFTGIWYWNKMNLNFNHSIFNNIFTPIISIIAVVIYTLALNTTIKQNKIILSQTIKPHFEREIEELKSDAESKNPLNIKGSDYDEYNLLNYHNGINEIFLKLSQNKEYLIDLKKTKNKERLDSDYVRDRSYYLEALILNGIALRGNLQLSSFYRNVKDLTEEINSSQLIEDEKKMLLKRIKKIFLEGYFSLYEFMSQNKTLIPPFPLLFDIDEKNEFIQLHNSPFKDYYELYDNIY